MPTVFVALVAFFAGLTVLVATTLGVLTRAQRPVSRMRERLAPYAVSAAAEAVRPASGRGTVLGNNAVARSAVDLAECVVVRRGLDGVLGARLEAAGLPLRTAEWLVLHVSCAVGCMSVPVLSQRGVIVCVGPAHVAPGQEPREHDHQSAEENTE